MRVEIKSVADILSVLELCDGYDHQGAEDMMTLLPDLVVHMERYETPLPIEFRFPPPAPTLMDLLCEEPVAQREPRLQTWAVGEGLEVSALINLLWGIGQPGVAGIWVVRQSY